MAKVKDNPLVQALRGSIGNLVFRRMPDGNTYVSKKHDFSRRIFSQGQKDHQSRFRQAAVYARQASKSQPIYAEVAKGTVLSRTILRFRTGSTRRSSMRSSGRKGAFASGQATMWGWRASG